MSLAARGLYRDLLDFCYKWRGIPSDRETLIRMAATTPQEFDAAWEQIKDKFEPDPDQQGWLINKSIEGSLLHRHPASK
jgi:hypothetical protein